MGISQKNTLEIDEVLESESYLEQGCKNGLYPCFLGKTRSMDGKLHQTPLEIASSLLVLETSLRHHPVSRTVREMISACMKHMGGDHRINFFLDKNLLPEDAETSSWGLSTLVEMGIIPIESLFPVIDEILSNTDVNGIIQVYFQPERQGRANRIDHVALADIFYFLNLVGRGKDALVSQNFVSEHLENKTYLEGSRYYHSPDVFLYFLSRLMRFPKMRERFHASLRREVQSRFSSTDFPLDVAMRVTIANILGIDSTSEKEKLLAMRDKNGVWPSDAIYRYGGSGGVEGYFGSSYISTSFALEALVPRVDT